MNKILALDPGDKHTGTALSDTSKSFSSPYKTVKSSDIISFLENIFSHYCQLSRNFHFLVIS